MRKNWFQQLKEWLRYNWKYVIHQLLLLGILIVLILIMFDSRKYPIYGPQIPDCWNHQIPLEELQEIEGE